MKGAAAMELIILEILIAGLIAGLAVIVWMIARNYFADDHFFEDKQLGKVRLSETHDPEEPQKEHSSRQSKATA
jgi:hypothetical protein